MGMNHYHKIITPFLMGQRREGLRRIETLTKSVWDIADISDYQENTLKTNEEKLFRMGKIYTVLSEKVAESTNNGVIPVSIAGDCVSSLGVLAGLQKAGKEPDRIIWLDAHGDFHTWETSHTKYIGGMPLAMLTGHGDKSIIDAVGLRPYPEERVILSDARDLDDGEKEALNSSAIKKCAIDEIAGYIKPGETIYLHWDTDVLSEEESMPALKYHVKGGPSYQKLSQLFRTLRTENIIAISVSSWHEEMDKNNKTALQCLHLLDELGVDVVIVRGRV